MWGVYDDEKKITQDDLKGLLDLAYEIQANRPQSSSEYRGIDNGSSLLISTTINSLSVFICRNKGIMDRFALSGSLGYPGRFMWLYRAAVWPCQQRLQIRRNAGN